MKTEDRLTAAFQSIGTVFDAKEDGDSVWGWLRTAPVVKRTDSGELILKEEHVFGRYMKMLYNYEVKP